LRKGRSHWLELSFPFRPASRRTAQAGRLWLPANHFSNTLLEERRQVLIGIAWRGSQIVANNDLYRNPSQEFALRKMKPIRVLFVCVHNSARSQMAEAYVNHFGEGRFEAESAGLEPGRLNPRVVQVMKEDGIDISENQTKSVFDMFKRGGLYSYVVTVCDETSAEKCPIFPGVTKRLHWSFADPSSLTGTENEKLERTREIRDEIKHKVKSWIEDRGAV